jgi:transposase-like protein
VTSDGAPGIIKAIEVCCPRAARQRCLAHYADVWIMPTCAWKSAAETVITPTRSA